MVIACLCFSSAYASLPVPILTKLEQATITPNHASFLAVPLEGGAPIVNHLANTPRVPASTQKLITTAIALDALGADFVWRTDIYHTGVLVGGVLYGDLVIVGSGDPSMDYQRFELLLSKLAKKINHITGNIYIDDGKFDRVAYNPYAFDGEGLRAYNASPNAFLINFGTVEWRFVPSGWYRDGQFVVNPTANYASVQMLPKLDGITISDKVTTKSGCDLPKVRPNPAQMMGAFGVNCGTQSLWQTFGDNQVFAKKAVSSFWRTHDKGFAGQVMVGKPANRQFLPLVSGLSRPMSKQIWQINQFSNNVMTEQVALSLPLYVEGRAMSNYPMAFAFLDKWWYNNIGQDRPIITRASGLCTDCLIRPKAMADLLGFMYRHQSFEIYKSSLPVAGVSGTMKGLAKRSPDNLAIGRAWIKTGKLNDVNAMAGYVQGNSGKWYAVVAIINHTGAGYNPKATAILDEFLGYVATF